MIKIGLCMVISDMLRSLRNLTLRKVLVVFF